MEETKLQSGEYYKINGTKKVLYWEGTKWMKPMKDNRGRYSGYLSDLDKQPTIKSVEKINLY